MDGRRRLDPSAPEYPVALRRCFGEGRPAPVTAWGRVGLLDGELLGFFCSVRAPGDSLLKTYDLARALRSRSVTLVGGFQSPMEKEFLDLLLRGAAGAVVCPARGLGVIRLPRAWRGAARRRPSAGAVILRRSGTPPYGGHGGEAERLRGGAGGWAARGARGPGGKTERLCRDALAAGKRVFTLESPDNGHLIARGAVPVASDDPAACLGDGVGGPG